MVDQERFLKGNEPKNTWFWAAALVTLLISLTFPVIIKPIYRAAMFVAHILGWINTRLILGLIYYLIFTPISLIMKMLGKDPLKREFDKNSNSYWNIRDRKAIPKEQYLKQF